MNPILSAFFSRYLIDRSGNHRRLVLAKYEAMRRADFLNRDEREQALRVALARLLAYARARVPFYRAHLGQLPLPEPASVFDLMAHIPPVRRADIQRAPNRFLAEGGPPSVDDYTGGSTGTPLIFKVDSAAQQAREASLFWSNGLAGWKPGYRVAMLWGSDRDNRDLLRDWRLRIRWHIENIRWYNAFNMGEAEMVRFDAELRRFRPHLLVAYAGALDIFARFLEKRGESPCYPLCSIVSSAEVLTREARERAERVFGKPVFDRYGNREAGAIAAECDAHLGLHINEHDFFVEIESSDPYQEPGPILITYLANRAMPFIRYDTGDLGLWAEGECPCGRTTRRLARIVGRQSDTIQTASGRLIHGEFFTHVLYGAVGVERFEFVQESYSKYRLKIVGSPDQNQEKIWRAKILQALDPGSVLVIEYVSSLPTLPSGKRRFTSSVLHK